MKNITTVILMLCFSSIMFGQQLIKTEQDLIKRNITVTNNRAEDVVIWSDDFSEKSNWIISNDENNVQNWKITSYGPQGAISYQVGKINSNTPSKFALMDADLLADDVSPQRARLTNAQPINCSEHERVFIKFLSYYIRYNSQIYFRISNNNGDSWTDYEIHADYEELYMYANPATVYLDITEQAAGHDNILIQFYFDGLNTNHGISWMVDDVTIYEPNSMNMTVSSINSYWLMDMNEAYNCSFTFQNTGAANLNSVVFTYKVNEFESETDTIENLNLEPFKYATIKHKVPYYFSEEGNYFLGVEIKMINDEEFSQSVVGDFIEVFDNSNSKALVGEIFTSSTCAPCAGFNPFYDLVQDLVSPSILNTVKYQMNWPGNGDPYYTNDGGMRKDYYNVSSVPSLFLNGNYIELNDYGLDIIRESLKSPSPLSIELEGNIIDHEIFISGFFKAQSDLQNISLIISVNEKQTHENIGSNGESEFNHVMMKLLPSNQGEIYDYVRNGDSLNFSYEFDLNSTFIEEINDLEVVAFIQDIESKEIYQSTSFDVSWENETSNTLEMKSQDIFIYPNPAFNTFAIDCQTVAHVSIFAMNGQLHYNNAKYNPNELILINNLENGIYLVTVHSDQYFQTRKLIISK